MSSLPSTPVLSNPVLVLDTNVALDLFHFDDAIARPILDALQTGRVNCVATLETLEELRRVLAYPEFALEPSSQVAIRERYQALSTLTEVAVPAASIPRCSDPDDQKFLELAAASGAQLLVTKDRALLKLRRRCMPFFQVMTPAEAVQCLSGISPSPAAGI
jgi:putative PIN family toxin of toxin-antitoxin system